MTSLKVQIQIAKHKDAKTIAATLLEAFAEYRPFYTDAGFAATTPPEAEVITRFAEGPIWIALDDNKIVGTASVVAKERSLYVRGMAVLPAARGNSIGRSLLVCLEEYANEHNYERLFLSTTPFLHPAIRLYEQFGFRRTDEGPHDLFGTPLLTMEKTLIGAKESRD